MIGLLSGLVSAVGEDAVLLDVNGVGYVVQAGSRTLSRLEVGAAARLHIETQVREDAIRLFGFSSEAERAWFTHVQSIPGVGAKVALSLLDIMTPDELADAIALQDKASVGRANGVGPKLAARIVGELAGKPAPRGFLGLAAVGGDAKKPLAASAATGARAEALSALVNLGIDQQSASRAVATAVKSLSGDAPAPELIRAALKEVSR
jgi:Holliday junction DNA helicase RuvA